MIVTDARRKLAAILSADVAGYARLMSDDETATLEAISECRVVFAMHIEKHLGRIIDSPGDHLLAEFVSSVEAVECAVGIQHELARRNRKFVDHRRMEFRIGINVGDVLEKDGALYGDGVNVAARLSALAEPGGVAVSEAVYHQVDGKADLSFESAGEHLVKNIARPVRAFRVKAEAPVLQDRALALPHGPSVAVLPFTNMSTEPAQDFFSEGITEEIITGLARFRDLFVLARNTTFPYKGPSVDIKTVHQQLGARYILAGSVRRSGNMVRVVAQLIDGPTGINLWAEAYQRELTPESIFAVQDDITTNVIATIAGPHGVITRAAFDATRGKATESFTAYAYVLRARAYSGTPTVEDHRQIRDGLERAVNVDPEYADAWAWLAHMCVDEHRFNFNPRPGSMERGLMAARRAVALEPNNQQAHFELALALFFQHEVEHFFTETERAIDLNPNNTAIALLGVYMGYAGKWDEAVPFVRKLAKLNPNHPGWFYFLFGKDHYRKDEYEAALADFRKINLPNYYMNHVVLAYASGQLGYKHEAEIAVSEVQRLYPGFTVAKFFDEYGKYNFSEKYKQQAADGLRKAGLPER